jgi:hypothetical protein
MLSRQDAKIQRLIEIILAGNKGLLYPRNFKRWNLKKYNRILGWSGLGDPLPRIPHTVKNLEFRLTRKLPGLWRGPNSKFLTVRGIRSN